MRNHCVSLAFDKIGSPSHVNVRLWIHGAFAGELTIRREEEACLRNIFYDSLETVTFPVEVGRMVGICRDEPEERGRLGFDQSVKIQRPSIVSIDPAMRACQKGGV